MTGLLFGQCGVNLHLYFILFAAHILHNGTASYQGLEDVV